jgi:hypothetical protein
VKMFHIGVKLLRINIIPRNKQVVTFSRIKDIPRNKQVMIFSSDIPKCSKSVIHVDNVCVISRPVALNDM